jgi:hypothetical protein
MIRKDIDWRGLRATFHAAKPFPHVVIDDFFDPAVAEAMERDIPAFDDPLWWKYSNPLEEKRALNLWDRFPAASYQSFSLLCSEKFLLGLRELTGIADLSADEGLHGGGWHLHPPGGKLNVHLDYSIHPKLGLERRLNLICYMTSGWKPSWGGALGFWSHDEATNSPKDLVTAVECRFNRAVIFDTTSNSWHGLPVPITCPPGMARKSIATYYLSPPRAHASERGKALYAPYGEQSKDPAVLELIRRRADVKTASSAYRTSERRQTPDRRK